MMIFKKKKNSFSNFIYNVDRLDANEAHKHAWILYSSLLFPLRFELLFVGDIFWKEKKIPPEPDVYETNNDDDNRKCIDVEI